MNDTSQLNDASDVSESIMKQVRRGSDPIPGVLPLVGLGLPQGKTSYEEADLKALKSMGLNTMSAHFPMEVKFERVTGSYMYTYVTYDGNLTKSIQAGASVGMRVIAGTEHAVKEITSGAAYDKIAWSAIASNHKNKYGCPAWMLNVNATVDMMDRISDTASVILEQDHWHKPVIYPLLPGSSTIEELGGSTADGWTESEKFDCYCNELEKRCPPSIWWATEPAYPVISPNIPINRKFLSQLGEIRVRSYKSGTGFWSTVHCGILVQPPYTGVSEDLLPDSIVKPLYRCIGAEAHAALAMGARGLVFDSVCGDTRRMWYPARNPQQPTLMTEYMADLLADINKVSEAFMGTYVENCYLIDPNGEKEQFPDYTGIYQGILSDIKGMTDNLIVSHLIDPNSSKDYYVVVNAGVKDQTVELTFDESVENLNPTADSESKSGIMFSSKIESGGWRVFSHERSLADFGIH